MGWHFNRTGHSVLYILIFLLLGLSRPVPAHKGRVAIAMHLEGIRLDGDLGDWPTTLPWYPISQAVYGRHPQDEADYTGRFKIGYNTRQNTLLLAVEVQDQTIVADPTAPGTWDTQDGCTVYLDVTHQAPDSPNEIYNPEQAPMQFTIYGDDYQDEGAQGRVHREKNVHSYEWEINLEKQLVPGVVMGIGVLIGDLDGDGAPTWMAWNKGLNKFMHADRLGDLILVDTPPVKVSGNLQWAGSSEGVAQGRIRFQSLKNESLKVDVEADREGFYTVSLPPGRFRMIGGFRDGEKETKTIEILTGEPSQVNLNVRPSALGSEIEHMPQQTVRSERGLRQGEWAFLGVTAPYPRTSVHSMMQDQKGNLWFGTHNNGISRYDGEQFTVFGELNEKRLGQISVSDKSMSSPFQFPVQLIEQDVTEQGGEWPPLRGPLYPRRDTAAFHHTGLQIPPDQEQNAFVADPSCHPCHQHVMVDSVEEFLQVHVHHESLARCDICSGLPNRLVGTPTRTKAKAGVRKRGVEVRL